MDDISKTTNFLQSIGFESPKSLETAKDLVHLSRELDKFTSGAIASLEKITEAIRSEYNLQTLKTNSCQSLTE